MLHGQPLSLIQPDQISKAIATQLSPSKPLKAVVNYGVGVDHLDLKGLAELNIPASNTPNVLSHATADMAWAMLMACARRIPQGHNYCQQGHFTQYRNMVLLGKAVQGATLGIIGMGRIGEQIARRASGFDMTVLYHNRKPKKDAEAALGVKYADLETLLRESDYVVLACPCTEETTGLINAERFTIMKDTASLINVSRGPVVVTDDLVEALLEKHIDSAGLDVFDPEPLPVDHPLYKLDNVVCAPHRGSGTREVGVKGMSRRITSCHWLS
eukprot:m.148176 g.148176  ORF g.148176 m.148176 type:complete len:271 (+) comp16275_c0_seq28:209-1021(+)